MNVFGAIVIYIVWWWVIFLGVLPINIKSRWEEADDGVEGADPGAPTDPQVKKKMWLATKIAAGFWVATVAIIVSGIFNFRE